MHSGNLPSAMAGSQKRPLRPAEYLLELSEGLRALNGLPSEALRLHFAVCEARAEEGLVRLKGPKASNWHVVVPKGAVRDQRGVAFPSSPSIRGHLAVPGRSWCNFLAFTTWNG